MRKPRKSRLERAGTDQCVEFHVASAMLEGKDPSVLMTDGYKFSMAQAGFPLRRETFYLSFRREGNYYIPFDFEMLVRELLPDFVHLTEQDFLDGDGYLMTSAMRHALDQDIEVWAAPAGTWVREREPIVTITGPSFLVSWLEPLVIAFHFPIQIATHAKLTGTAMHNCTCESEAKLIHLTLGAIEFNNTYVVKSDPDAYRDSVRENAEALVDVVGADRVFEVGMRGATCLEMHEHALIACNDVGIDKTSNVWAAEEMGMTPIGTTGHEHQQRWGNDLDAFEAIRDMRPQTPSYLFDTFDPMKMGIPAAVQAMVERPDIPHAVRFDSGDQEGQFRRFLEAERKFGIKPRYMFMDGINAAKARQFELLCEELEVPPERVSYGSGGFLVCDPSPTEFTRNKVSAVYKLSQTGERPVMKFSVPTKMSLPGKPVIFRSEDGRASLVGQANQGAPRGFHPICHDDREKPETTGETPAMGDLTRDLWEKGHALDKRVYVKLDDEN